MKYFVWIKTLKFVILNLLIIHFNIFFPSEPKKAMWQDCWHVIVYVSAEKSL